ncbi:MAG: adenine deaminase, partial [Bacteroidales bacterium]|nr:adenine deaminase [Bacteroidales bacterium]
AKDGELITNQIIDKPKAENGFYISDIKRDILKIVVQNRYEKEKPSVGFIHNFGLKYGGMISTIAHDSHNIICIATNDEVICSLLKWVNENNGGIAFSDGNDIWGIPLPIAGIISNEPAETIAEKYHELEEAVKAAGSKQKSPFMTLSFMSLLVIPHLKLGNKGLFDVNNFKFVDIYAE